MSFPRISTKATNITVTYPIDTLLEQKFSTLDKLINPKGDERCEIELEKLPEHVSGKIYRAEVNFYTGGKLFRAEATEETIEQAIDKVKNELKHELQHAHGKRQSLFKRGRRAIKSMLRGGE